MRLQFLAFLPLVSAFGADNALLTTGTQRYFDVVRRNLEASAEAMPAEKFSYRLTPQQMTFAEWINHSTQRNYLDCGTLRGEPSRMSEADAAKLKEKAEVTKALKESFAYCADALKKVDDQKVISTPQMSNAFLHLLAHNNEIYGNVVGYLRSSGIVPPSTASRQKK
jgi:hypothetical protein